MNYSSDSDDIVSIDQSDLFSMAYHRTKVSEKHVRVPSQWFSDKPTLKVRFITK